MTSSSEPVVSFVVPSYQKVNFIEETLRSLVGQTSDAWEAIIVENGSTDGSMEIIEKYCRQHERMRWLDASGDERNGSLARNLGLAEASGRYVIFLDADDILMPYCVERRVRIAEGAASSRFLVFPVGIFEGASPIPHQTWVPEASRPLDALLFHRVTWHTMGTMWRREFIREIGGFDDRYSRLQDIEVHIRALVKVKKDFAVVKRYAPDALYRTGHVSATRALVEKYVGSMQTMLDTIPRILKRANLATHTAYLSGTCQKVIERIARTPMSREDAEAFYEKVMHAAEEVPLSWRARAILDWYRNNGALLAQKYRGINFVVRRLLWTLS